MSGAVLTGLAHTAVCVPDVDEAVRWYSEVLGMRVLSPPYLMEGPEIEFDVGELIPSPVVVKAAIVGFEGNDHVLEIIEYPAAPGRPVGRAVVDHGPSHVGLLCDDLGATRAQFEDRGVVFLTAGNAGVAGLRTCWFVDPNGVVFILMEKSKADRPYYHQY
ncbi:MAG TPA: VOC family protein [Acidimicrobiales bacterium]|nr:VOC family protein [Acidimicrobiales bacterium]